MQCLGMKPPAPTVSPVGDYGVHGAEGSPGCSLRWGTVCPSEGACTIRKCSDQYKPPTLALGCIVVVCIMIVMMGDALGKM